MKFREHLTRNNTLLLAGRNAENNEELIKQVNSKDFVLHTALPGSPFVWIKGKNKFGDKKEAAIFCAVHSQAWRNKKSDVIVHIFRGGDIYKEKRMKKGTFGIKKFKKIKVNKGEIEKWNQYHKSN
jgi:predicted ribosome quality control (RQC) complex YloA/Tae2 family protein